MSKLNKLIKELCPNGVEYRKLGEVCKVIRGKRLTTRDLSENGCFPVFHGGIDPIGYYQKNNRDANSAMVINVGASAGTVGFSNKEFWSSDGCFCFSHEDCIEQKFLFYALQSIEYAIKSKVRKAGIPTLDNKEVDKLLIPVPPLPIQSEIVKILDRFAEYTAELQARKEQYEYYRNLLLTNNFAYGSADDKQKITGNAREEWKWMTLGEVCEIKRGKQLTTKELSDNGKFPVYHGGIDPIGNYNTNSREANSAMVINVGASAGTVGFCEKKFWSSDGCFCFSHNEIINQKFLFYSLQTIEHSIKSKVRKAGIPTLDNKVLERLQIPIPPMEEQQRIVSILDKFEALVSDLTQGLPAEIAASQERYEYYRDKLLRFERCN